MIPDLVLARTAFIWCLLNVVKEMQQTPVDLSKNVPDPVPHFNYSWDLVTRSFLISFHESPDEFSVKMRLCYLNISSSKCTSLSPPVDYKMDTAHSLSANISFPYVLPCLCIEAYYNFLDARRIKACPFQNMNQNGLLDVLSSSKIRLDNNSKLAWQPLCPSVEPSPPAQLCWNSSAQTAGCVVLPNTTLPVLGQSYNVSDVDSHPQMCIQISLNNSHRVHCPFKFGHVHQWEVTKLAIVARHIRVSITSTISASFAGQSCVYDAEECVTVGDEHYVNMEGGSSPVELVLPCPFPCAGSCVQVWRREPLLHGRRIFSLEDPQVHRRWGLIMGATLAFLFTLVALGNYAWYQFYKRFPGVVSSRPVLLVSSSDEAAHVSAVLALASGLQAELRCSVRLALWDHCASQASVAHLGPIPWLHAQCQAVLQSGGLILIAWSPGTSLESNDLHETSDYEEEERAAILKGEKDTESCEVTPRAESRKRKRSVQGCEERCGEETSVTVPVLVATLSCLQAARQSGKQGDNFILLHFQRKTHSDGESNLNLPSVLHTLTRYYLPQNLPKLVSELCIGSRDSKAQSVNNKKTSFWLWLAGPWWTHQVSRRLAQRLQNCRG